MFGKKERKQGKKGRMDGRMDTKTKGPSHTLTPALGALIPCQRFKASSLLSSSLLLSLPGGFPALLSSYFL